MRSSENCKPPYIARVEKIEADNRNNIKVRVRWYYRPEESRSGRRPFHGSKELFLSNHFDVQSAHTIEGKCVVHPFKTYTKVENVGTEDYFCRFEYDPATGGMMPYRIAVYCKCELPYNPDDLMVQCEECKDWYGSAMFLMHGWLRIKEAKIGLPLVRTISSFQEGAHSIYMGRISVWIRLKRFGSLFNLKECAHLVCGPKRCSRELNLVCL